MVYFFTSKEFEDLAGMKSVYGIHTIFYPLIEKPDTPLVWLFILSKTEYIKIDRDKSTFKSHRDFDSEIEMTFKHF